MRLACRSLIQLVGALSAVWGCALPAPPDGGPRDQEGPLVRSSSVALGATSVQTNSLEWTFDEFVVLNNPGANLRFSPPLPSEPRFNLGGKSLRVQWDGTLAPDRTYVVQFGSAVKDLHEGNPMKEPFWVFATGEAIDSGEIRGVVMNPVTGKAWDNQAVVLHGADAPDSAMYRAPLYGTRSGKDGGFTLPYLAQGRYRIFGFSDPDGNLQLGTGEQVPIAWFAEDVGPGDSLVLWLAEPGAKPDSVAPYRPFPRDSSGVLRLTVAPAGGEAAWVHQLRRDGIVLWQGFGAGAWTLEGLKPGKYQLQSFVDRNANGLRDAPNWWTRTAAELPVTDAEAIEVTVGWTVERQWLPGATPAPQTDPGPQGTGSASAPRPGE